MSQKPSSRDLHDAHAWERVQACKTQREVKSALDLAHALEARRLGALLQDHPLCDETGFCEGGLL